MDGVGAIIISPTRELAYQIFETLKKVGSFHDFSAGLIIGGKNLKFERSRMDQCNIIICTPGRLLQHMDENPLFDAINMQILVLDEADRCLDLGFEQTMNAIIENLPSERQTLLFSATQTKSVKDLARLSLNNPVYVAPHEQQSQTPSALNQNYVVIKLEDKITMLWSFIKNHLKQKVIVFLSSCKQVKYFYEIFCKLRPGISLLALYGTLHQDRRIAIYDEFCRKSSVVLFATDIASRGLDFPVVNWVIQLDCPEDVTQYIHRAGRTARHNAKGESLLVLMPNEEEAMIEELNKKGININKISIDPKRLFSPRVKMEAFLAQNKELKESAQRAFVAYIKSVYLMKNKNIFNVNKLNHDEFARSLGLVVTPRIRFLERIKKKRNVKESLRNLNDENQESQESSDEEIKRKDMEDSKINFNIVYSKEESDDDDDGLLKIKRQNHEIDEEFETEIQENKNSKNKKAQTKAATVKRILKKKIIANKKVIYNEEGEVIANPSREVHSDLAKQYTAENEGGINIEIAKQVLQEEDKYDKERFRSLIKTKKQEKKKKLKNKTEEQMDEFESEIDSEVDLSWLPDPDKVRDQETREESENESEESYKSSEEFTHNHKSSKKIPRVVSNDSDESDNSDYEPIKKKTKKITNKLTLNEAELLAMELLNKK